MAKKDVKTVVQDAGKAAGELFDKTKEAVTKVVDANDDGKFDAEDIKAVANKVGGAAQGVVSDVKKKLSDAKDAADLKALRPVFKDDIDSPEFVLTKLIRITEPDKKHQESKVCEGSIGHYSKEAELKVINMYRNDLGEYGLTFYPDTDSEVYYIDPVDRDHYIALDEYFKYLKIARINELQRIALDLGAKHFTVRYVEYNASYDSKKGKGKAKAASSSAESEHEKTVRESSSVEIAAEMDCLGHAPVAPVVKYYAKDDNIQMLISSRLNGQGMTRQKYTLKLSRTSGIKEKDAAKIGATLNAMKCGGSAEIISEARREDNSYFEYEIDF